MLLLGLSLGLLSKPPHHFLSDPGVGTILRQLLEPVGDLRQPPKKTYPLLLFELMQCVGRLKTLAERVGPTVQFMRLISPRHNGVVRSRLRTLEVLPHIALKLSHAGIRPRHHCP